MKPELLELSFYRIALSSCRSSSRDRCSSEARTEEFPTLRYSNHVQPPQIATSSGMSEISDFQHEKRQDGSNVTTDDGRCASRFTSELTDVNVSLDESIKRKEEAVLQSLESNADKLRAALLEFESITEDRADWSQNFRSTQTSFDGASNQLYSGNISNCTTSTSHLQQSLDQEPLGHDSPRTYRSKRPAVQNLMLPRSVMILLAAAILISLPSGTVH